ncbi:hypothetical protein [Streptomyces sp. NRRL B-3648]|uniref:hypothetical protein n=1 Tax=Streptomyces sp. NRRL B-3648 TaxID=1519493 RepID=UPI00131CAD2F|nr:hypothetical protein [Streptomyces sp. NRRL B-3648]
MDVGCGTGELARHPAASGHPADAVDRSAVALAEAGRAAEARRAAGDGVAYRQLDVGHDSLAPARRRSQGHPYRDRLPEPARREAARPGAHHSPRPPEVDPVRFLLRPPQDGRAAYLLPGMPAHSARETAVLEGVAGLPPLRGRPMVRGAGSPARITSTRCTRTRAAD